MNDAAQTVLGSPTEWKEIEMLQPCMEMVARISTRVFLGLPLCRDPRWLRISTGYTFEAFQGGRVLRFWPERLRPIVHWFLSDCRKLRSTVTEAQEMLKTVLGGMVQEWEQARAAGKKEPATNVIFMMLDAAAKIGYPIDKIDFVHSQLGLSAAAVHTTTDMVTQTLLDLCCHPEYLKPLRDEIEGLMATNGGVLDNNTKLSDLRFMDSLMKEVQRVKPVGVSKSRKPFPFVSALSVGNTLVNEHITANSRRVTTEDVTLSDGTFLRKGSYLTLYYDARTESTFYPNPDHFDPYRSLRAREQAGKENMHQFVSTAPEAIGFGHGIHACTGRFFANNEIKIMLCHLLMHYDWKLPEGSEKPGPIIIGAEMIVDPKAKLMYRKRVV